MGAEQDSFSTSRSLQIWYCRMGTSATRYTKAREVSAKVRQRCDAHGVTPLAWAAMEGHEKVVELLLDSDVDINAMTALYAKSHLSWGGSRSVKSYVRHASDGDAWWTGKHTVLYRAAFRGHEDVVHLLIR